MATGSKNNNYQLLEKVLGYGSRKNDILLFPNSVKSASNGIVYYFGGDIQVRRAQVMTDFLYIVCK